MQWGHAAYQNTLTDHSYFKLYLNIQVDWSRGLLNSLCGGIRSRSTAWDSEIESLTSLIKLHQNERRSAPCGQIGAATLPRVLAAWLRSPTLKKFRVARAFKVRWTCTCCYDMPGFNCYLSPLSHFSLFFVPSGALHNPERSLNSRLLSQHQHAHQAPTWWHDDVLVRCRHTQQQPFRTLRSSKNEPQQRENKRIGKREHERVRSFPGWLLPTLHGFFLALEFKRSREWSRRVDELKIWIIRKKKAVVK